jgi:protein-S-isoprenylcysteine O-methyltransferase Ste14
MLLRHLLAILALPFVVIVIVPRVILVRAHEYDTRWLLPWALGVALGLAGFVLWAWCVWLFARVGQGTLAPWDPTRRLVAIGPYRHVRNPMISGVLAMLFAEALFFGSVLLAGWAAAFWLICHVYFLASEEPGLRRRFGQDYRQYEANVPRWLPRRTPWNPIS